MLSSSAGFGLFFSSLSLLDKHLTGVLSHFMTAQNHYIVPVFRVKLTVLTLVIDSKENGELLTPYSERIVVLQHIYQANPLSKFEP